MVRPHPEKEGEFMIVYGECRFRAHQENKATEIKAVVREISDATEIRLIQTLENASRRDLSIMEAANNYKTLVEGGCTIEQISKATGKSAATISNDIQLTELPGIIKRALDRGEIVKKIGHRLASCSKDVVIQAFNAAMRTPTDTKKAITAIEKTVEEHGQIQMGNGDWFMKKEIDKTVINMGKKYNSWMNKAGNFIETVYKSDNAQKLIRAKKQELEQVKHDLGQLRKFIDKLDDVIREAEFQQSKVGSKKKDARNLRNLKDRLAEKEAEDEENPVDVAVNA
jgi:ParB/RepB/Spo0J family partition protein